MQWLRNPGLRQEKRTLFGDMVCFLLITPLATISGWLCLRGAVDHLHFSSRLEAVGLIALTVALFTIYLFWTLVSITNTGTSCEIKCFLLINSECSVYYVRVSCVRKFRMFFSQWPKKILSPTWSEVFLIVAHICVTPFPKPHTCLDERKRHRKDHINKSNLKLSLRVGNS